MKNSLGKDIESKEDIDTVISEGAAIIAYHYGMEHQLVKIIEELGELSTAIAKAVMNRTNEEIEKRSLPDYVLEEIADVKMLLTQLTALANSTDKVDYYMVVKLYRQIKRIADEQKTEKKE